jgi:DNA gyrase subunit A
VVVTVSREGYLRQIPMAVYQRRANTGRGLSMERWENDFLEHAFVASTEDTLLFFTADGRAFGLAVRDVPEAGASSRGKPLRQIFDAARSARLVAVHRVGEFRAERFVLFATADGSVKRSTLDQYARARSGIEAISLKSGDRVVDVRMTDGEHEVVLAASAGRGIRFPEAEIPAQGRVSQGVRGMKLKSGEVLVGMAAPRHESTLLLVTERGMAKRLAAAELPLQKRDGLGVLLFSAGKSTGALAGLRDVRAGEDLMAITAVGRTLRVKSDAAPQLGRTDQPQATLTVSAHDRVMEVTALAEREQPMEPDADSPDGSEGSDGSDGAPTAELAAEPADESPDSAAEQEDASGTSGSAEDGSPGELDLFG